MDQHFAVLQKYECNRALCHADFDGDGVPGKLFIDYDKPLANFDSWFVVEDSGRQLLKQPRRSYDGSLRTHAAILDDPLASRLIIYDHIRDGNPPGNLVFVYDGSRKMVQVPPQITDEQVLAALATTDDAGTKREWLLFQVAKPVVNCFLAALVGLKIVTVIRLSRRAGLL